MTAVGVLGVGGYFPPDVRRNDWWSTDVVEGWRSAATAAASPPPSTLTEGQARVLREAARFRADPFQGVLERRVLAATESSLDAAVRAASDALDRSNIDRAEIDLLLTHTVVAEHAMYNPACALHERLGLSPQCLALETEATGYTALAQIALAEGMIASGRVRRALLVQVSVGTRLIEKENPGSAIMGDCATSIVLGQVRAGLGVLGVASFTEGKYPTSLIMSTPSGRWYDGRARIMIGSREQLAAAHLRTAESCEAAVRAALARANVDARDLDYLCVGQGTAWLHNVVARQLGLELPEVAIFSRYGYLASAHVVAELFEAEQGGQLVDNDLVAIVAGGTGMTYGAIVLRWGAR